MRIKLFPRYRRPSIRTLLGITQTEKAVKRNLGIYNNPVWKAEHMMPNAQRRLKRRAGYYSTPMKVFRWWQHH
jgi:hypothetical protein